MQIELIMKVLCVGFSLLSWETLSFQFSTRFPKVLNSYSSLQNYKSGVGPITITTLKQSQSAVVSDNPIIASIDEEGIQKLGKTVLVVPYNADQVTSKFGSYSPIGSPSVLEAAKLIIKKISWFSDGKVDAEVVVLPENIENKEEEGGSNISRKELENKLHDASAVIALNIAQEHDLNFLTSVFNHRKTGLNENTANWNHCQFAIDCGAELPSIAGPYDESSPSFSANLLPWTNDASRKRMVEQMLGLFQRWTSDDFVVALMIFFNQYSDGEIDWVKHSIDATYEKGLVQNAREFYDMITKCGDCVTKCVGDEKCKECLDKLTEVDTRDQVASYRLIVSYESELLKDFSYCILQKNNIFGCDAKIPTMPKVEPMKNFRGVPLTQEMARKILVGHLDDSYGFDDVGKTDISWKVAAGANVAYDQFPSQNQIFYESANKKDMWYDPVFRVETIDGRNVWCKRHYKVRSAKVPGTFRFSVLDNGVTSNEFWTIVAAADDLSWIVFHYAGAATSVGQRYLGGLVCTADGTLPPESARKEIWPKLQSAGIEPWELFVCDNRSDTPGAIAAGEPPLDYYRKTILTKQQSK